jgi:hypothetical protein
MASKTLSIEIGGQDLEVELDYSPGDPGRTSGPPEKCYPPEDPSIDITKVKLIIGFQHIEGGKRVRQLIDITDLYAELEEDFATIEETCWEALDAIEEHGDGDEEYDYD